MQQQINPEDYEEQYGETPIGLAPDAHIPAAATPGYRVTKIPVAQEELKRTGLFSRLGTLFSGSPASSSASTDGPSTENLDPYQSGYQARESRKVTSAMTPEELRTRRMNMIENAKFGRPAHESFMLFLLKCWLFIGPIVFVALTTSEVAYILTSLVAKGDTADVVITGGALFIDIAMMFVTFGVAIKRRDMAEKRESGGIVTSREEAETTLGTIMWLVFALINIISQSAFLLHIISQSHDPNMTILYVFVASRVAGFILGDASTAFFLAKVDSGHLRLIARGEREKGIIYNEIAKAEGERKMIEAKADSDIQLLQIKVQQEREDAEFLAELKRQVFQDILVRRRQPPSDGSSKTRIMNNQRG